MTRYRITKDGQELFTTAGDPHAAIMAHARASAPPGYPLTDMSVYQANLYGGYQAVALGQDTEQEQNDVSQTSKVIRLSEPLPCGVTGGGDVPCGRPSWAAYLDPDPGRPGQWCLTPVCKVCAAAMAAMYAQGGDPTGGQPIGRPPGDDAPGWLDVYVWDRDPSARRYVAQLQGPDSTDWEDCAYFDDPGRAARFCRSEVGTNPNVSAGRVFDQETGQVWDKDQGDAGK